MSATLLARARDESGLTQSEVARRAGTSRPTLSAYEHGRTSPTMDTAQRVLAATGHELAAVPVVTFTERVSGRGRVFAVPDRLPRLPVRHAMAARPPVQAKPGARKSSRAVPRWTTSCGAHGWSRTRWRRC